jgi:hypothetical protein
MLLFPQAGIGGYDVRHYHLDLSWQPVSALPRRHRTVCRTEREDQRAAIGSFLRPLAAQPGEAR